MSGTRLTRNYPSLGERGLLSARKLTPAVEQWKNKFASLSRDQTILTDECEYFDFTKKGPHTIGSDGFAGCAGLVVASAKGAIVGHWTVTDASLSGAEATIKTYWDKNKDALRGATAVVYAEVKVKNQDEYVQEKEVNRVADMARSITGISPDMRHYVQPEEFWFDDDEEFLSDADMEHVLHGGLLVENEGGGAANTVISFIDIELQHESATGGEGLGF